MKIGIDIRTLMDAQWSGVSEYTYNIVKGLLKLDTGNHYKLFYNSAHDVSERIPHHLFSKVNGGENVEIIKTKYPNKLFNFIMQKGLRLPKVDKLLGVDAFFMPNIGFISLSARCKKILTIHDLSFLRYPEFFNLKRRLWHWAVNVKKMIREFDTIIAVSESTKKDVVELCNIDPEKVKVIYSGISDQFRIIHRDQYSQAIKIKLKLPDKFILCLSTLEPRKNIKSLIMAYNLFREKNKDLDDIKLVIAGPRGWGVKKIKLEHERSKYKDDIIFLNYVKNEDKVYVYNLAEIFVFPSFYEGFGFPPLEAAKCGLPVIAGQASSFPEILGDGAMLIDSYNIRSLAEIMAIVLKKRDFYKELVSRGEIKAKGYSWDKTAQSLLDALKL